VPMKNATHVLYGIEKYKLSYMPLFVISHSLCAIPPSALFDVVRPCCEPMRQRVRGEISFLFLPLRSCPPPPPACSRSAPRTPGPPPRHQQRSAIPPPFLSSSQLPIVAPSSLGRHLLILPSCGRWPCLPKSLARGRRGRGPASLSPRPGNRASGATTSSSSPPCC
jgi:hypothetical protein